MTLSKKASLCFAFLSFANICLAQTRDSIPQKLIAVVADKFPSTRVLNIEFTQLAPYKFSSKLHNADLLENKVGDFYQVKANTNLPFIRKKKWILGTILAYRYTSVNVENPVIVFPTESREKGNFHYHSEAIYFTYFAKLLNKTTIFSATLMVDGSEEHFERARGIISGTMILKANARTKIAVGVVAFIDPSTRIPALPIFSYEHRFKSGLVADVVLPKKILMKKDVFSNGRIAIGAEMDNTAFYIYNLNKTYEFRQLEINSGLIYEHKFGAFISTLKTGVRVVPNARLFEKSASPNDYIFEAKPKSSFYFNLGISYNPFGKAAKK